ncbi:hypothetical protein BESB_035980 [Besnoitia besnoiti]|uniref:RNA-editing substrate-binding complex 6 protein domain-containing protein n=1 Tax=Besnoitia besnoiti TaxID=94643 RepID=A0A2A9MN99_BESBE|nr:hypothetical protein BESB_035980 [Besnoitia besnoiti]PFH37140.1 hypothetical protein BESB_035980 [Besnoitia besnoiti]
MASPSLFARLGGASFAEDLSSSLAARRARRAARASVSYFAAGAGESSLRSHPSAPSTPSGTGRGFRLRSSRATEGRGEDRDTSRPGSCCHVGSASRLGRGDCRLSRASLPQTSASPRFTEACPPPASSSLSRLSHLFPAFSPSFPSGSSCVSSAPLMSVLRLPLRSRLPPAAARAVHTDLGGMSPQRSRSGASQQPDVPLSRVFAPFDPSLKSPFQLLARPDWRRGEPFSLSAAPAHASGGPYGVRARNEAGGDENDILIRDALWWMRHTRHVTVEVVDQWTESFHFLYRKKRHAELVAILDDALHIVPCLRPAEIAMLANHASRLIPLKSPRAAAHRKGGDEGRPRDGGWDGSDAERDWREKRSRRWWGVFGDAISHLLHDADGQHISLILNAFSSAKVFHHETLLACLSRETAAWAPHNSIRNTAVTLNAMARLNMKDRDAVEGCCRRIQVEAKNLNHIDCAMSLNAAARLGYRDLQFYSALGDASVQHCSRMNEHNVSMILWAFGTVGVRHQALIGEFIDQLLRISSSREIHANYVASVLGPLGNLRVEHPRLKLLVEILVKPNIEKFEPVDVVLVCTALSRLGFRVAHSPVATQLLNHAGRLVASGVIASPSHHVLHLSVAAGLLEAFSMTAFWSDISGGLAAAIRSTALSAEIANAVLPLVRVAGNPVWRAPLFQVAVTAMAAQDQSYWTPRDVANFLFALGKTAGEHAEDPVDSSVFCAGPPSAAGEPRSPPGSHTRGPEGGQAGRTRRQLIRDLCDYSTREMERFNPCDIVRLLQGLASLDYRHEGVLAAVSRRLQHADGSSASEADGFPFHVQRSIAEALLKLDAPQACSSDWTESLRSHHAAVGHKGRGKDGAGDSLTTVLPPSSCFKVEEISDSSPSAHLHHTRTQLPRSSRSPPPSAPAPPQF